jgi:hypothetical protein
MRAWVHAGAPVPADLSVKIRPGSAAAPAADIAVNPSAAAPRTKREFSDAEKNFWAFQKFSNPPLPAVKDSTWVKSPLDRFILAKLEEKKLKPSPPADKATLLRRVAFDLTGLPPSEAEIKDFLEDHVLPKAYEKVVDRLLASPRYGEQWGRHWLDVARYADSTGTTRTIVTRMHISTAITSSESFNKDIPSTVSARTDRGRPAPLRSTRDQPGAINRRGLIATGFLALGQKALGAAG